MQMLRNLYNQIMSFADHRKATWVLSAISFAESSFFPIPPDPLYLAMTFKNRSSTWPLALLCTLTSVLGGYVGYLIGYAFYETIGKEIVEFYGATESIANLRSSFNDWGFWIIILKGITPIPYKFITIASGLSGLDLYTFTIASLISRGFRFFYVGLISWYFGTSIKKFIEKNLTAVTIIGTGTLIIGFIVVKYIW